MKKDMKKIKFANVGRNKRHEVTLVNIAERNVDMTAILEGNLKSQQSFADENLTHYWNQAREYLKAKGFKDIDGHFKVINGEVVQVNKPWMPLWSAIRERDKAKGGQTGKFLAAIIDHRYKTLLNGGWPPRPEDFSAVLDIAMEIQSYFFQLYLLTIIQPQYSAGKARTHEANEAKNLKSIYFSDAEAIYRKYRAKSYSKESCYQQTSNELKKNNPDKITPQAATIKSWLKSRKNLP